MIRKIAQWLRGLLGLLALTFSGLRWIARDARADAETEVREKAAQDNLTTRKRIDDATRYVPEPGAARERLQQFGAGTGSSER